MSARKEGFPVLLFDSLKCDKLCNVTRVTRVTRGCRLAKPDNRYVEARQGHVPRVCSPLPLCAPVVFESVFADKQNNGLWERRRRAGGDGDWAARAA